MCRGKYPHVYERDKDRNWKEAFLTMMKSNPDLVAAAKKIKSAETPMHLTIIFHMPTPKYRKKKVEKAQEAGSFFLVDKKPDLDNMEKAVMDAMEDFLYDNDNCVASKWTMKVYATDQPKVEVHAKVIPFWMRYDLVRRLIGLFDAWWPTTAKAA